MQALVFSWLTYLFGLFFLEKNIKKLIYPALVFTFLLLILVGYTFTDHKSLIDSLWIFIFYLLFLYSNPESSTKFKVIFLGVYLILFTFYFVGTFYFREYIQYIIPIAGLGLLFRQYENKADFILWSSFVLIVSTTYIFSVDLFYYSNILFIFYFIKREINRIFEDIEKEKKRYKDFVDRAINSEIQKKYEELNDELKVTYKKLKEIFNLSAYTLSPSEIEDIAEKVVEGLHSLGYPGVVLFIDLNDNYIFKKSGFFPNIKSFLDNRFQNIEHIDTPMKDKYIFLPLQSDKGKIGVLGVYKKEGFSQKENEYLSTYANSVAISLIKTIYFKKINQLQELLEKTFESVDIGIAIINKDFEIEKANKALKILSDDLSEKNIFNVIPEISSLRKEFKNVMKNKKSFETSLSSINKKGSTYRIKALPLVSSDTNDADKLVLVIEDITEKEKLEAQLLETEKHAVIGKLAAGLSHDIKNPLAAISASAFAIKKRGQTLKDERIVTLSEKIEQNAQRAADIISRLLNYAKPSYYKIDKINLKEILLSSIDFSIPDSMKKNIKIYKKLSSNIYTYGDKNALQQVFINLLVNAAEAMNYNGKIVVKLSRNGEYAVVSIKDSGPGIPEDLMEHIFDPFFTTKEQGTGLGLSVVSRIIKDHRGYIEVRNNGDGAEFIIKLPIAEE